MKRGSEGKRRLEKEKGQVTVTKNEGILRKDETEN
jgi:hypothetical protein